MQDNHTCFQVPNRQRLSLAELFCSSGAKLTWSLTDELLETLDPHRWRAIMACSFDFAMRPGGPGSLFEGSHLNTNVPVNREQIVDASAQASVQRQEIISKDAFSQSTRRRFPLSSSNLNFHSWNLFSIRIAASNNTDRTETCYYLIGTTLLLMPGHLSFMSTAAPSRIMLRHTRFIARQTRRHASTTEAAKDTAAKTKETASNATSKASGGLSRVTSSAGPAVSGVAQRASRAISSVGGRTGRMISFVQSESKPATRLQGRSVNQLGHPEY